MKKILLISVSALLLTSCGANKFLTSSTTSNEIKELKYLEPLTYVQYIEKGNKPVLSDSLSSITQAKLDSILGNSKLTLRLTERLALDNDTIKARIENELGYLSQLIAQRRKLDGIPITPTIDSILKSNNQRFTLATVATGFGRRKGNYGGQVAKGAAIGILTLGMYVPTPIKSNLTLHAFIFDSKKKEIAFYKRSMPVEQEPTAPEVIKKQLIGLFNGYFYEKK
ncbi:MAG: hypothetical protein WA913_12810 [Pricia sp.]